MHLLILKYLNSFAANFFKKRSTKSEYLVGTIIFLISNKKISAFQAEYINTKSTLKETKYTKKDLTILFNTI